MTDPAAAGLRRLAGLVFDQAARRWYAALTAEVGSVVVSTSVALLGLTGVSAGICTFLAVLLLLAAYAVRLDAESRHNTAQTMTRQAALSEGLGWPIAKTQLDGWRRRAGHATRLVADGTPLDPTYYTSVAPTGARRMAEMTQESAFYTWNLWQSLRDILVGALVVVAAIAAIVAYLTLALPATAAVSSVVAQVIVSVVLVAVVLDLLGWVLRLNRQASALKDILDGLDLVLEPSIVDEISVLRLVAEYNCETAGSVPLPKRFLDWRHDDIADLWNRRKSP